MSKAKCPYKVTFSGSDKYGKERLELGIHLKEILNKLQLSWYIENGTLLGAYRNQKFIKHDDDFDIALLYNKDPIENLVKDFYKIKKLLDKKYGIRIVDTYSNKIEVFNPKYGKYNLIGQRYNNADFHHVTVDLQAYELRNNYYYGLYKSLDLANKVSDVLPLNEITFENISFSCPNNVQKILKNQYGSLDENAIYNEKTKKYELNL